MRGFFVRLFKLVTIPILLVSYACLMMIPMTCVFMVLIPINIVYYLSTGYGWWPTWVAKWPEPFCLLADEIIAIKETK